MVQGVETPRQGLGATTGRTGGMDNPYEHGNFSFFLAYITLDNP
jgi:hypothetical protein